MTTQITTDWHIGAKRTGGTTPESAARLREYLLDSFKSTLSLECDQLICGDILDNFTVEAQDFISVYLILDNWLQQSGKHLAVMRGNHDHSERGGKVSSFDALFTVLTQQYPEQVTVAKDVTQWKEFTLVPHLPNNDLLDKAIANLPGVAGKFVVFHANLNNKFAAESQHSLNVTFEQVDDLIAKGATVLFGHEHQFKSLKQGRCVVLGNNFPSSISDCLGNDVKYCHVLNNDNTLTLIKTWHRDGDNGYLEVDWKELGEQTAGFIRVTGSAEAHEAEEVIEAVAKFRSKSPAFVVGNAVKIAGMAEMVAMGEVAADSIKSFDVLTALLEELDDREREVVKGLL